VALDPGEGTFPRRSEAGGVIEAQIMDNSGRKTSTFQKIDLGLIMEVQVICRLSGYFGDTHNIRGLVVDVEGCRRYVNGVLQQYGKGGDEDDRE
jgi:hypothetical protein